VTDLFVVDIETRKLHRLTNDLFADLAPAWSPDGRRIAFVTDRFSTSIDKLSYGREQIALIEPESGAVEEVRGATEGKNIGPQWSPDGKSLYFVSDRNGVSNLYRVAAAGGEAEQLTNLLTGVSGITRLSPAVSVARDADQALFSAYESGAYNIYALERPAELHGAPSHGLDASTVATLPPREREGNELERLIAD